MRGRIQEASEFYDAESSSYVAERYDGDTCEHQSYRFRKGLVLDFIRGAKGTVLDVGCGPAILTADLIANGNVPISADLSTQMVRTARSAVSRPGQAHWLNGELEALPFRDASLDNAVAIGVIGYAVDVAGAVSELARVVRPNGRLVLQCSNSLSPTSVLYRLKDALLYAARLRSPRFRSTLNRSTAGTLERHLTDAGYSIGRKSWYDFRLPFLERLFPSTARNTMRILQPRLQNSRALGWLGEGMIIEAIRREDVNP